VFPGAPEVCGDGVDHDCDGLVDCEDGDCFFELTCSPTLEMEGDPEWVQVARVTGGHVEGTQTWSRRDPCGGGSDGLAWALDSVWGTVEVASPEGAVATCDWSVRGTLAQAQSDVDALAPGELAVDFRISPDCPVQGNAFLPRWIDVDEGGVGVRGGLWFDPVWGHVSTSSATESEECWFGSATSGGGATTAVTTSEWQVHTRQGSAELALGDAHLGCHGATGWANGCLWADHGEVVVPGQIAGLLQGAAHDAFVAVADGELMLHDGRVDAGWPIALPDGVALPERPVAWLLDGADDGPTVLVRGWDGQSQTLLLYGTPADGLDRAEHVTGLGGAVWHRGELVGETDDGLSVVDPGTGRVDRLPFDGWLTPIGDVDGDGAADAGVRAAEQRDHVWLLTHDASELSTGALQSVGSGFSIVDVGDLNADGYADVAVLHYRSGVVVLGDSGGLGDTIGTLDVPDRANGRPWNLAVGDVNGDGAWDLTTSLEPNWYGGMNGGRQAVVLDLPLGAVELPRDADLVIETPTPAEVVLMGDVEGDGLDEILVGGALGAHVFEWYPTP
jgi:hypothetical protein